MINWLGISLSIVIINIILISLLGIVLIIYGGK